MQTALGDSRLDSRPVQSWSRVSNEVWKGNPQLCLWPTRLAGSVKESSPFPRESSGSRMTESTRCGNIFQEAPLQVGDNFGVRQVPVPHRFT